MPDRPAVMFRNNRPAILEFDSSEELFRRIPIEQWADGIWADQIQFTPAMSVNRSLPYPPHCLPQHVLYPGEQDKEKALRNFQTNAVLGFTPRLVPTPFKESEDVTYSWKLFHMPEELNYAHSELWTGINAEYLRDNVPRGKGRVVKAHFRQDIAETWSVIFEPGEGLDLYGT